MPRGQVLNIHNQQAVLTTTLSREEKASIAMLNPNDGVLYVKLNGPASNTPTLWDWKVPSQSYCQLPGPWSSLGVYYSDQSGSGADAQVNVYESDSQISIPSFIAIGRAVQSAGTTVDISTGSQPQNPPPSTARLWVDGSGHLHVLQSNGTDFPVVDANNVASYVNPLIAATALGGDLSGTIPNGTVNLRNNIGAISGKDSAGNAHPILTFDSSNYINIWCAGAQYIRLLNQSGANDIGHWDNAGTYTVGGWLYATGGPTVIGSGTSPAMANGGLLYWHTNQTVYTYLSYPNLIFVNANLQLNGASGAALTVNGTSAFNQNATWQSCSVTVNNGNIVLNGGTLAITSGNAISWGSPWNIWANTGAQIMYFQIANGGAFYFYNASVGANTVIDSAGNISTNGYLGVNGNVVYLESGHNVYISWNPSYVGVYAPYGNGFVSPFFKAISGFVATNGWSNASLESGYLISCWGAAMGGAWSIRSVRALKENIVTFSDRECLARIINPSVNVYQFTYIDDQHTRPRMGLMADELHPIAPEFAFTDIETGEPESIEYGNMTAMFWGAVRELERRVKRLEIEQSIVAV